MATAKAIEALRKSLRMSQADFAQLLQTTITTVSRWENGKVQPNREALEKLATNAKEAGLKPLAELFEAQRKAAIATRISKLPSAGTGRHVSLRELSAWADRSKELYLHFKSLPKTEENDKLRHAAYSNWNEMQPYVGALSKETPASINKRNREFWSRPENQPENQPEHQPKTQSTTTKGSR